MTWILLGSVLLGTLVALAIGISGARIHMATSELEATRWRLIHERWARIGALEMCDCPDCKP